MPAKKQTHTAPKNQEIEVQSKSLDDALKSCGADLNIWEVERYAVEETTKGFNYKITFKKKVTPEDFGLDNFLDEIKKASTKTPKIKYKYNNDGLLLEFAPFDLHWGKLAWGEESGEDYDMKIAAEALREAVDYTIEMAKKFAIERIIFPFGQDFFQIDNEEGTTTAGTRQDTDSRFKKIFREGRVIIIETIEKLKQLAPVDVIIVSGNHGRMSEYMLGDLLSVKYENDPNVTVNNAPTDRKIYKFGDNLIMFTHGDQEKLADLPLIMATNYAKYWADCRHRYIKIGHLHQEGMKEFCGVKLEVLPSLSATDAWHARKGYINNTRGVASSIYDKKLGMISKIYFNL